MVEPVIVFENGSGYLKAGLSDIEIPTVTMTALIGRPILLYSEKLEEIELKPIMIGDEVVPVRSLLELAYPMKEGIIVNDEDIGLLWEYCIRKKLGVNGDLKDRKILLTESPANPNDNKK